MLFALVLIFAYIGLPFLCARLGEALGRATVASWNKPVAASSPRRRNRRR